MHRFFVPPEGTRGPEVELSPAEAHHALHVVRLRRGDPAWIIDGEGGEYLAEVISIGRKSVCLRIMERRQRPSPACAITLVQGLPKPRAMDLIVQKATELGAHRIVPLVTERTIARGDPDADVHRVEKWRAAAVEACKQSGNPWLPLIESPVDLPSFLARREPLDLSLLASLHPDAPHPRICFDRFRATHTRTPASVALFVGPEGDFAPHEVEALTAAGACPVNLGPLVLRSETAALACLVIARYETQTSD